MIKDRLNKHFEESQPEESSIVQLFYKLGNLSTFTQDTNPLKNIVQQHVKATPSYKKVATVSFTIVLCPFLFLLHRYAGLHEDSHVWTGEDITAPCCCRHPGGDSADQGAVRQQVEIFCRGFCVQTGSTGSTECITNGRILFPKLSSTSKNSHLCTRCKSFCIWNIISSKD